MKTAMAFGTFDILHPGHVNFLNQAKSRGGLIVVIARDKTVKQIKGELPHYSEKQRLKAVKGLRIGVKTVLGSLSDKYAAIKKYKPDIICLGYDQKNFIDRLESELNKLKFKTKVIRLKAYKPNLYKTSILKNSNFN